jgi:hypothetical protein
MSLRDDRWSGCDGAWLSIVAPAEQDGVLALLQDSFSSSTSNYLIMPDIPRRV